MHKLLGWLHQLGASFLRQRAEGLLCQHVLFYADVSLRLSVLGQAFWTEGMLLVGAVGDIRHRC